MDELVKHLVSPFLNQPEEMSLNVVEGKGSILIELMLHEDDKSSFTDDDRFAVQHMLSLGTGKKKPLVDVVDAFTVAEEEKEESESSSDSSEESKEESKVEAKEEEPKAEVAEDTEEGSAE